ncbi:MAG: tannase/feruloyl esterase family alpha/beta hydrolase, partial [Pseudomonadota bacterium]
EGPDNFFGFPFGAEDVDQNGWGSWLAGGRSEGMPNAAYAFGIGIQRYFVQHDADWDYRNMDFAAFEKEAYPLAQVLNSNNPDLSAFRARGGKLLLFHGWADVALTAHMSTDYVSRVYKHDPAAAEDVRLFMMPGVLHCAGGEGPFQADWIEALRTWHTSGVAPETINASHPAREGARKLCAWPKQARHQGGNIEDPASYVCE